MEYWSTCSGQEKLQKSEHMLSDIYSGCQKSGPHVTQPQTSDPKLVIQAHLEMLNILGSKEGFLGSVLILG